MGPDSRSEHLPDDVPNANELEISLFGPGFGECLVVHYGYGRWLTIDSCLEEDGVTPSALAYLTHLGLDPSKCVTHTVVTHPDGDHIGGIAALFAACTTARLVCPIVLSNRDMISYVALFGHRDPTPLTQTTRELVDLLKLAAKRTPKWPLYVKQDTIFVSEGDVRVTALAPADDKVGNFLKKIAEDIPKAKDARRGGPAIRPNSVSAAVLFERGEFSAIFGADLEEETGGGWRTVLNHSLAFKAAAPARIMKVAHHGSANADLPALWAAMNAPVAILAPYKLGSKKLPSSPDVERILGVTDNAFSTASFKTQTVKKLSRVDKVLVSHGIKNRIPFPKGGHIRLRVDSAGNVSVDLFRGAVHLKKVH